MAMLGSKKLMAAALSLAAAAALSVRPALAAQPRVPPDLTPGMPPAVASAAAGATRAITGQTLEAAAAGFSLSPRYEADDYSAGKTLAILPPGANGQVSATQLLRYEATGARPPNSSDQLGPYDNLIYAAPTLTGSELGSYFLPETFGVAPGQLEREVVPDAAVPVRIYYDSHGIPHIYGKSIYATAYGAGYAAASERLFLMDVLRHYGSATLSSFAGPSCSDEELDAEMLLVAPYTPAQRAAQISALPAEYGRLGAELEGMAYSYVAGINRYIAQIATNSSLLPADYLAVGQVPKPWVPGDLVSIASLIGAIFGSGGGAEVQNAALLQYLTGQLRSPGAAMAVFDDLKDQNDPAAPTTILDRPFPYDLFSHVDKATLAMPDDAAAPLRGGPTVTTPGCDLTAPDPTVSAIARALEALPHQLSNAVVVSGRLTASGHPIAVMGPQVGYYAPQILMQEDLHAPDYAAEGATFPGTSLLVEVGRGPDFAWTATSAEAKLVDQRADPICNPEGGPPQPEGKYYLHDGRCLPMVHETFTEVAPTRPSGLGAPAVIRHQIYLTNQSVVGGEQLKGIVQGWTTVGGEPVAIVDVRSTYDHELDSGVGILRWNTPSLTYSAASWMKGAQLIGYTFNWFYLDDRDIAYYESGLDPLRPSDVDSNLPAYGTGIAAWKGFLPPGAHPHEIDPPQGFFVNWNNKPAPLFSASDSNFSWGSVYRSQLLTAALGRALARSHDRLTRADLVRAVESAGTVDLEGEAVLPALLSYLRKHPDPRPGVDAMVAALRSWLAAGAHRRKDSPEATQYSDAAAVASMDELMPYLTEALFDGIFAAGGTTSYDGLPTGYKAFPQMVFSNTPNGDGTHQGDAYGAGWYGYDTTALEQLAGLHPVGSFSEATLSHLCGEGPPACPAAIADALAKTYAGLVSANSGSTDVASWTNSTQTAQAGQPMPVFDDIQSETIGVVSQPAMPWQNRSTFQQVVEMPGHRPR